VAPGGVFQELLSLTDEAGAKSIILQNRQRVAEFASVFPARLNKPQGWILAETPFADGSFSSNRHGMQGRSRTQGQVLMSAMKKILLVLSIPVLERAGSSA
jgi:hypothetical protein